MTDQSTTKMIPVKIHSPIRWWGSTLEPCPSGTMIAENVSVQQMPTWLSQHSDIGPSLHATQCVVMEFEIDKSILDNDSNLGWVEPYNRKMLQLSVACWLAGPFPFIVGPIVYKRGDKTDWTLTCIRPESFFPGESYNCEISSAQLAEIGKNISIFYSLQNSGTMWSAIRTLQLALSQTELDMRFLSHSLLLECLFGAANSGEINYRLSNRIAFFLESDRSLAKKLAKEVRGLYKVRSTIAHGKIPNSIEAQKDCDKIEKLVRRILNLIFEKNVAGKFNLKREKRDEFLDDLMFNN